jgi:hypothetical protein
MGGSVHGNREPPRALFARWEPPRDAIENKPNDLAHTAVQSMGRDRGRDS